MCSSDLLESALEIRVSDTGAGVPEDIRSRIFEPARGAKIEGPGLATAYRIMTQRHLGSIALEASDEGGATFVVRLPVS